jgi:enoyl-CoA hydratase/carnithine racemase
MTIRRDVDGHVLLITIDRPHAMNALDPEHNDALADAIEQFEADVKLRVAVLTGAGTTAFCAGADLKRLIPSVREQIRAGHEPSWNFGGITRRRGTKPLIAAVNGHALAGGLEIALACDMRLASPNATFGLAETKWAIIPGAGGTQRLPRAVPLGHAMEMILTGDPINASEAHRIGLVNRLHMSETLVPEALKLAARIAKRGPLAVRAARRAVVNGLGSDLEAGLAQEYRLFLDVMRTEDAVEGTHAFAQRREPVYQGR